jgi:hypothetical protein
MGASKASLFALPSIYSEHRPCLQSLLLTALERLAADGPKRLEDGRRKKLKEDPA